MSKIKTLQVTDEVHILIGEKQLELRKKGIEKSFIEITEKAIKEGLCKVT